ncbi:MAG: acyl carrier protein [Bacteroidales bacterium]|nr:acyl carrier protein [Bacteroidales bacterium]MDD2286092.1 acyl carrier protein [Paludibacter sp.]
MDKFIEKFTELFDNADIKDLNESTHFKEIDGWCSLIALFLISMADEEYHVSLKRDDILKASTIGDIYHIIQNMT